MDFVIVSQDIQFFSCGQAVVSRQDWVEMIQKAHQDDALCLRLTTQGRTQDLANWTLENYPSPACHVIARDVERLAREHVALQFSLPGVRRVLTTLGLRLVLELSAFGASGRLLRTVDISVRVCLPLPVERSLSSIDPGSPESARLASDVAYERGRVDALRDALASALDRLATAGDAGVDAAVGGVADEAAIGDDARPASPDAAFRGYYNDACAKIETLERRLRERQADEKRDLKLLALLDAARELREIGNDGSRFHAHALDALEAAALAWTVEECSICGRRGDHVWEELTHVQRISHEAEATAQGI